MTENDPTDLREQQRERDRREVEDKLQRDIEIADFKWLMRAKQGRRFVWRWLSRAGVFRTSFRLDTNETMFCEGQRNMGLLLLGEINEVCPELYAVMVAENQPPKPKDKEPSAT